MKSKCVVCKSSQNGNYYLAFVNDDFANEIRKNTTLSKCANIILETCESCIERIRNVLVGQGKSYLTCPKELIEASHVYMGPGLVDKSIVEPTQKSTVDSTIESTGDSNGSVNRSVPQQLNYRKRPMPLSEKRKLIEEENKRNSSTSSTNKSNSRSSTVIGSSESFMTGHQKTSTQLEFSNKRNNIGQSSSSNSHSNEIPLSQQTNTHSLVEVSLTEPPNTVSVEVPLSDRFVVQLSDLAGVTTQRGHMRVRRASSEITNSSDFIPMHNDEILAGNSSYSRGREHSNVAAPSRITNVRRTAKNQGG